MTQSTNSSKIIFIAFIAISLMATLSITTHLGTAAGFTQCSDGINNDPLQDDLIDRRDPGCHTDFDASNSSSYDPNLNSEINPSSAGGSCPGGCPPPPQTPQCSDNRDNDGDNFIDWPEDPACDGPNDNNEFPINNPPSAPQCDDGQDNDGDNFIDWPEDPSCDSRNDNNEFPKDNQPPNNGSLSCSNPSFSIDEGDSLSFDLHNYISGTNSNSASFNLSNQPGGSSFSNTSGVFSWNTDSNDEGNYGLAYTALLGSNSCSGNISIDVDEDNNNDDLRVKCEVDDRNVEVGESVRFRVDIDNDNGSIDIDWRGDISGDDETERVRFNRPGTYEVSVRVEDNNGRDTDQCPDVKVGGGNNGGSGFPFFTTTPPVGASQGNTYIYDSNAIDPDGTTVTYSLLSGPSGMTISPINGLVQWIPTSAQANRSHGVQVRATDRDGDFAFQSYSIFVQGPTIVQPPVIGPPLPPVASLEIFNLRVDNDEFNNVIASYNTNISASSRVYYSLNSHFEDNTTTNYENQVAGPNNATFHQVNLGQLEINRTYYLRAFASTSFDSDLTSELAFVLLPNGVVAGTNNFTNIRNARFVDEYALVRIIDTDGVVIGDRADASLASALAVIGALFLNPWFLLLIIIILLVILLLRRGRDTYISGGGSGPVEIRS